MHTTSRSGIRIRTATPDDGDAVVELASLVDLHLPTDAVPTALTPLRLALSATDDGPLSHQDNHFLIAEDNDGFPLGLIVCGPPKWITKPGRASGLVRRRLRRRISSVHMLAVRPEHRRRGVARDLLQQAEETFRDAGYAALTLRHDRELTAFYRQLGYTSANRLSLMLPPQELFTLNDRPWKHAFKVLSADASVISAQGLPTITGILPS
ncbi:GNAT family N-acetyltransferase (plasmid) [Streptomyces sp. NBC_00445]|uniref:GNAT family N-acetyltransferase n=1 Tax=Streptomyces sp. NBC_00445 TaxID=2975745 RepID=UPI002E22C39B